MRFFVQLGAVLGLVMRSLPQRTGSSAIAVVGVAGVVLVFVAVLSVAEGFRAAMVGAGSPEVALVMRGGSDSELSSTLDLDTVRIVSATPGVRRSGGLALASAELFVVVDVVKSGTGTPANVPLRGSARRPSRSAATSTSSRAVASARGRRRSSSGARRPRSSRASTWGTRPAGAARRGRWSARSTRAARPASRRCGRTRRWSPRPTPAARASSRCRVRLESAGAFDDYRRALDLDPRVAVATARESDYYSAQSVALHAIVTTLGFGIATLMAFGAVFGAVNTMYSALASRTREIATLRALGFDRTPVVLSVVAESVVICLAGGLLGGAAAYFGFNGYQTATLNWQTFSQVAFAFLVTPELLLQGFACALVLGVLGGFCPPSGRPDCR